MYSPCARNRNIRRFLARSKRERSSMKDETRAWLNYAAENLDVAELSLAHNHLNACLQNAQQAVEKYLKALIIEYGLPFKKTHAIFVLWQALADQGFDTALTEEDGHLLC